MEKYKGVYSSKEFHLIPETIFDLHKESDHSEHGGEVIGGITSDTTHSWLAIGPYLQVFYSKLSEFRSVWCFGVDGKEPNAKIVSVQELKRPYNVSTLLVVGLQYGANTGMVCVYNLSCATVLRAIEIPQQVTSLHVVSPGADSPFPGPLSAFDGILAVGTADGAVYVIDLCKELITTTNVVDIRNESHPCQLRILTHEDIQDLEAHKTAAEQEGTHVAILLNAEEVAGVHFELKTPQGKNVILVAKEEVDVSSLQYAPQLCSLFVGYNFGALQIWNFLTLSRDYTSPVYAENMPVSFIAIQEPIDDPRAFCYFWVVYSYTGGEYHNAFPLAALYSINYESKDYHEGYGNIYRDLRGCSMRFQANLRTVDTDCSSVIGANCIQLKSHTKVNNVGNSDINAASNNDEYAVAMLVWNVRCKEHKFHTYLSVFDLNQWYKEQMPALAYPQSYMNYMTNLCLTEGRSEYPILDAQIDPASISPFVAAVRLEEHYRPSSLAFTAVTITEVEVGICSYLGSQRGFFRVLEQAGPLALMHPDELYSSAKSLGLAPLFQDMPPAAPANIQCDILLSIALERRMVKWLSKCATSWGNGSHRSVGLSLELLLNWAWERTKVLKTNVDRCCASLFNYSGCKLDANVNSTIKSCRIQFGNLKDLFCYIVKHCDTFLVHPETTRLQLVWLQKNYAYFNVMGWMINMGILPESRLTYPKDDMSRWYQQRRLELKSLDPQVSDEQYLFVDRLTNIESLHNEWKDLEGGNKDGYYPPTTVQTLLRTYFNEKMDVKSTHALIAYALLDLIMYCQGTQENHNISAMLIKFPQIFDLSMNTTKTVQALWQLDRGQLELEPAVRQLVKKVNDPIDIISNHHRFVVKVLMLQRQYHLAMKYMKANIIQRDSDDIKQLIQLHVRNNMLFEALSIQRRHADDHLLEAFFLECLRADVLMQLVSFKFTKDEELTLLKLMDNWKYARKEEFKTIYFVRRGRFLDFYMRYDESSLKRNSMPSLIKNSLDNSLPAVTKNVINTCLELRGLNYQETKSLSAFVCSTNERAKFHNDFIKACVVNGRESWNGNAEMIGEDYPFMQPPYKRETPPVKHIVYTKNVIKLPTRLLSGMDEEADRPEPPSKRMRLDTLVVDGEDRDLDKTTIDTYFHRSGILQDSMNVTTSATPLSILKTTLHSQRGESTTPEDLDDLQRVETPKITSRSGLGTPTVRFTGISSTDSSFNTLSFQGTTTFSTSNTKESTTTDYFSAEPSPDVSEVDSRKRKFSEDDDDKVSIVQEPSFRLEASILRSSVSNHDNQLMDSIRRSYVAEAVPQFQESAIEMTPPIVTNANPLQASHSSHQSVFVFTGADEIDTSGLSPKARDTYQTREPRKKEAALSRQVLESNASKAHQHINETSKTIITKSSVQVAVINGEEYRETKTMVREEIKVEVDTMKEVSKDEAEDANATGDGVEHMDTDVSYNIEGIKQNESDLGKGDCNVEESKQNEDDLDKGECTRKQDTTGSKEENAPLETTVIDLTKNAPKMNASFSFTPSSSPVASTMPKPSSVLSKERRTVFFSGTRGKLKLMIPFRDQESKTEISEEPLEEGAQEERVVVCEEPDVLRTPHSEHSVTTIELLTPQIGKSFYERPSFVDYFSESYDQDDVSKLETFVESNVEEAPKDTSQTEENSVLVENVAEESNNGSEISDSETKEPKNEGSTEVETDMSLNVEVEPNANIYEDLSNSVDANYIVDPVMSDYNPQEADDQAEVIQVDEDVSEVVVELPQEGVDYESNSLPAGELFEPMDTINNGNSSEAETPNLDVAGIITIDSSDNEADKQSERSSYTERTDKTSEGYAQSVGDLEIAFIADSDSLSNSVTNTSKETLDENVNEVKSIKSESDQTSVVSEVKDLPETVAAAGTPKRRTRRSSSLKSEPPALTIQLRPRRSSAASEASTEPASTSKPIRRKRSMSTEASPTPPRAAAAAARRAVRAKSVDVVALQPIDEEVRPSPRRMSRRLSELRELKEEEAGRSSPENTPEVDLLKSRRLTRNQKQMISEHGSETMLDKGGSDLEETAGSTAGSRTPRRSTRRSMSVISEEEVAAPVTPKRGRPKGSKSTSKMV